MACSFMGQHAKEEKVDRRIVRRAILKSGQELTLQAQLAKLILQGTVKEKRRRGELKNR